MYCVSLQRIGARPVRRSYFKTRQCWFPDQTRHHQYSINNYVLYRTILTRDISAHASYALNDTQRTQRW